MGKEQESLRTEVSTALQKDFAGNKCFPMSQRQSCQPADGSGGKFVSFISEGRRSPEVLAPQGTMGHFGTISLV